MDSFRINESGETFEKFRLYHDYLLLVKKLYCDVAASSAPGADLTIDQKGKLCNAIILLAFSLEAFINEIGLEFIQRHIPDFDEKDFEKIECIPSKDKWLLFPKLCGKVCFEAGKEPLQSIEKVFAFRNVLAHSKPRFEAEGNGKIRKMLAQIDCKFVKNLYENGVKAMRELRKTFLMQGLDWLDGEKAKLDCNRRAS